MRTAAPTPCPLQTVVLYAVLQAAADGAVQRAVLLPAGGAAVGHAVTPGAVLQRGLVSRVAHQTDPGQIFGNNFHFSTTLSCTHISQTFNL